MQRARVQNERKSTDRIGVVGGHPYDDMITMALTGSASASSPRPANIAGVDFAYVGPHRLSGGACRDRSSNVVFIVIDHAVDT